MFYVQQQRFFGGGFILFHLTVFFFFFFAESGPSPVFGEAMLCAKKKNKILRVIQAQGLD